MKKELASTLKVQGLWRGVTCREGFRKKGIHISSPLEEYARSKLLPELESAMKSTVAVRRELDPSTSAEKIFAGMVDAAGEAHGWGCIIFPKSDEKRRTHFMGEFADGLMHGVGVLSFQKGARFEGLFQKGVPHGFGVEYYTSGAVYQGQFEKDLRHGFGIYTFTSGNSYGGSWKKGSQHGEMVEINILLPTTLSRPAPPMVLKRNKMAKWQENCVQKGQEAIGKAKRLGAEGDEDGAKESVRHSFEFMDVAFRASEEMRASIETQQQMGRSLVKFQRGKKIVKPTIDPNAIATQILEGGWVELAVAGV